MCVYLDIYIHAHGSFSGKHWHSERESGGGGWGVGSWRSAEVFHVCVCVLVHIHMKKGGKNERRKKKGRIRSSSFESKAINFRNSLYLFLGMKHMMCHFLAVFFECVILFFTLYQGQNSHHKIKPTWPSPASQ